MVLPVRNQQQPEDIRLSTSTLVGGLIFFSFLTPPTMMIPID